MLKQIFFAARRISFFILLLSVPALAVPDEPLTPPPENPLYDDINEGAEQPLENGEEGADYLEEEPVETVPISPAD